MRTRILCGVLFATTGLLFSPLAAQTLGGCAVFPADNAWNARVDQLPVDPNSSAMVNTIGATKYMHADFGSGLWDGGPIGIPFVQVPGTQARVPVTFTYSGESDPGPYPVPANAPIEGGAQSSGDRHVLVLDTTNCVLYELYSAYPQSNGTWQAGSGAVYDLKSNSLRPQGWTSADAAGLPILPGLVRYDEVLAGEIRHAIRFTAPQTRKAYVWPARHYASSLTATNYPPMGQRFRLRADFDVTSYSRDTQVILRAMKTYGLILADNGSSWYISGAPDERWNNDVLRELGRVAGSSFEAVDASSLMVNPDSGQVRAGTGLAALTLNPTVVAGGSTTTANSVALAGPAGTGGVLVSLYSSDSAAASVPASVAIPQGASSTSFSIATAPVSATRTATITASYQGVTRSATLTVTQVGLAGLGVNPAAVVGGAGATLTVTLNGAAPAGGIRVDLSSSSASAPVPASITVPQGATSAAAALTTQPVQTVTAVTFSASYAGVTKTASLSLQPAGAALSRIAAPSRIRGGSSGRGYVYLTSPAPAGGSAIKLTSSNPVLTVPATVTVSAGSTSRSFQINTSRVKRSTTARISATQGAVVKTADVTVAP